MGTRFSLFRKSRSGRPSGYPAAKLGITLHAGDQIAVVACDHYWCKIELDHGGFGYVAREYVTLSDDFVGEPSQ